MTTPAAASAAQPTVPAEAFVRSRDGRSILEWDEIGPAGAKSFVADPGRLRTAVGALEERGFTVDGIDRVSIGFHGPPDAFVDAFDVRPVRDPAAMVWTVAGAAGFDVPAGSKLGGTLYRVVLRSPSRQSARKIGPVQFGPGPAAPIDLEFVLGETADTIGEDRPERLGRSGGFPGDPKAARTMSDTAMQRWLNDPLRARVRAHIATQRRSADRRRVLAVITEERARVAYPALFGGVYRNVAEPSGVDWKPRVRVTGTPPSLDWDSLPVSRQYELLARYRGLDAVAGVAQATVDEFVRCAELVARNREASQVAPLTLAWRTARSELDRLRGVLGDLIRDRFLTDDHPMVARWPAVGIDEISRLTAGPNPWLTWTEARRHNVDVASEEWRRWAADGLLETRLAIIAAECDHSAMVGLTFCSVARGLVDLELLQVNRANDWMPVHVDVADPMVCVVYSNSGGDLGPVDAATLDAVRAKRAAWTRPAMDRFLDVQATANYYTTIDAAADAPDQTGAAVAALTNGLVVGGCVPAAGGWRACENTQGFVLEAGSAAEPVVVPGICAMTSGDHGGSVIFPNVATGNAEPVGGWPWYFGGGASQSTPIVAAVCAIVWSVFPDLPSSIVKDAVLAGAQKFPDGAFHMPAKRGAEVVDRSNLRAAPRPGDREHAGYRRVVLRTALRMAREKSSIQLSAELAELLAPPPRGAE